MSYHRPATHTVYYIFSPLARKAAVHVPSQLAALVHYGSVGTMSEGRHFEGLDAVPQAASQGGYASFP
jgi:hypothetical protein